MNEDLFKKYEEYKQARKWDYNKEKYKLLVNFMASNPSDVNGFRLTKRKKVLIKKEIFNTS